MSKSTNFYYIAIDPVLSQRLIGNPPGSTKHVEKGKSISVTCSPDSTASAVDLKWYGPSSYNPASSEPHLIQSRTLMPNEEDGSFARYELCNP